MEIKFVDLTKQYDAYRQEIDASIQDVILTSSFILGEAVKLLEQNLRTYTGARHVITCASGTDALLLALMAYDIRVGDEVITTPFTFFATGEVVAILGARPVFVDIDEKTYNIDPAQIERKITGKTRAIMPVSLYGQPADMDEINKLARARNIPVIEDAAQSFGAEYKRKKSCNLSSVGCTSFFPAKPLGCYGDGGALFTNDDELAMKLRTLMNHGQSERYVHKYIGINGRLDSLQAAVLNVKLKYYSQEVEARQKIASRYSENLGKRDAIVPFIKEDRTSVFAQYSIRVKNRKECIQKLGQAGIPTAVHYPIPVYRQEAFAYLKEKPEAYPNTEKISSEIMSLPMHPFLSPEEQNYIIENF